MKYALCLHGMAFGTTDIGNTASWEGALPYFKENVLRPDVDVFLHTWGEDGTEWKKLVDAYKPVAANYEKQIEFPGCPETRSIYSRWYSAGKSVSFKDIDANVYSGVLLCRYDLVFKVPFPWDMLDTKKLWTPKWRQKPSHDSGYLDYWFYSSPFCINYLTGLYTYLTGWFDSGLKQNGHNVVEKRINRMIEQGALVDQWGEQPENFQLYRRMMGATS